MDNLTFGIAADQDNWPVEELDDVVLERAAIGSPIAAMTPPVSIAILGDKFGGECK